MDDINEIFLQYVHYLEVEQDIKDRIIAETKTFDRISYAITLHMEIMHSTVNDKCIHKACKCIKNELLQANETYKRIEKVVPANQFYRYNFLLRTHTQKMVQATALMVYLTEERFVTLEETASFLGLRVFSNSLTPEPDTFSACVPSEDANICHKNECKIANEDGEELPQKVSHGVLESEVKFKKSDVSVDSIVNKKQVITLATSDCGTQLIFTPATPCKLEKASDSCDQINVISSETHTSVNETCKEERETVDKPNVKIVLSGKGVTESYEFPRRLTSARTENPARDFGLNLDIEDFLLGSLTIGAELARLAVNAVSSGNYSLPFHVNQFLRDLHAGYSLLHLKNGLLRKTFDELKYSLKKTEDVVYNLSLRGLRPVPPPSHCKEENEKAINILNDL